MLNLPRFAPGHFYSPLTNTVDRHRAIEWSRSDMLPGVEVDEASMRSLAEELGPVWGDLATDQRFSSDSMYCESDAMVYQSMIRRFRPRRIIEIGSGFSTAVALDTSRRHELGIAVTCVEPYPARLRQLLGAEDDIDLLEMGVQDVPLATFDALEDADFLFIDSTHVAKAGSDVVWNIFQVLPRLRPGVVVHIHDMFWPFEYRAEWLAEGRDWNELYFVRAFLMGNAEWEILLFNDWVWTECPGLVERWAPGTVGQRPGGLWLRRRAGAVE